MSKLYKPLFKKLATEKQLSLNSIPHFLKEISLTSARDRNLVLKQSPLTSSDNVEFEHY